MHQDGLRQVVVEGKSCVCLEERNKRNSSRCLMKDCPNSAVIWKESLSCAKTTM